MQKEISNLSNGYSYQKAMSRIEEMLEPQRITDPHVPFYKYFIENSRKSDPKYHNYFAPFFKRSKKIIIDANEFGEFYGNRMRQEEDVDRLNSVFAKYRSLWVEIFDLDNEFKKSSLNLVTTGGQSYSMCGFGAENGKIFALARDNSLPGKSLLRLLDFPLNTKKLESLPADEKSYFTISMQMLAVINHYLDPEITDVEERKIGLGPKKMRKGKLKQEQSEFQLVKRKRKLYIVTDERPKSDEPKEPVEWQSRWEVKGHWRRVKGLGKDQFGNPNMGMTWVKECVKGPEDKPLVKKTIVLVDRE